MGPNRHPGIRQRKRLALGFAQFRPPGVAGREVRQLYEEKRKNALPHARRQS